MSFPCSGCGCCCKRVDKLSALVSDDELLRFPYGFDETGRCEKLGENDRCNVYEERPLICNVEEFARHFELDITAFYNANISSCNKMMDEDGIAAGFRINKIS